MCINHKAPINAGDNHPERNLDFHERLKSDEPVFLRADEALALGGAFQGPVIVDLDETLYLSNSTNDYINLAWPFIPACYVLRILDILRPWYWTHHSHRDNWRVIVISLLFPWTLLRWRRFCTSVGSQRLNKPLLDMLMSHQWPVFIATNGYRRLVQPLLQGTPAESFVLISCSVRRFADRRGGKAALCARHISEETIAKSVVITDSIDDLDILSLCKLPLLTRWDGITRVRKPRDFAYVPIDYLHRIKQPNQRVWRILLREDIAPWVLICLSAIPMTAGHVVASLLLFGSLWAVYEAGYFDNDRCAAAFEHDAKISKEFGWFSNPNLEVFCWVWALVLGIGASWLFWPENIFGAITTWVCALVACRLVYWFYNRIDKNSRVFVYPALQAFRFGAPIAMIEISAVGVAIIVSQILPRWFEYCLYRYNRRVHGQGSWPKTPTRMVRLVTFSLMLGAIVIMEGLSPLFSPATAALILFAYSAWRTDGRAIFRGFSRIDRALVTADVTERERV